MEQTGMDAVLAKLSKKLGRKPMLKRKGLTTSEPLRPPGMTVVIGLGKPMGKKGAFAKRDEKGYPMDDEGGAGGDDEEMVTETSPEGLSAKLDALMERLDAIEEKMGMNEEDDDEMEDEDESDMEEED
jgi:hypothetical protein